MKCSEQCQGEVHAWGRANQVSFDPSEESFHILSLSDAMGMDFKFLGLTFDCNLSMGAAIDELAQECSWKLKMILFCQFEK